MKKTMISVAIETERTDKYNVIMEIENAILKNVKGVTWSSSHVRPTNRGETYEKQNECKKQ